MAKTNAGGFVRLIQNIRRGMTMEELDQLLADAQQAVNDTGKMATLSFSLKIKPVKGMSGQFQLEDSTKAKLPEHDRGMTVMFEDKDCNLVLNDPRQQEIELRSVPVTSQTTDLVQVPEETNQSQLKEVH